MAVRPGVEERHVPSRGEGVGMHALVARHIIRNRYPNLQLERPAIHVDLEITD
jgi:hypothetical protein